MPARSSLILLCFASLLLGGCVPSMLSKNLKKNVSEQLYVDARNDFSVRHPLDWQLLQIPVSSPEYRADTIRWQIIGPQQTTDSGEMLIRSLPSAPDKQLSELLDSYLAAKPKLNTGPAEKLNFPAGPALQLKGLSGDREYLTIALKGQVHDFIIALDYPGDRSKELLSTVQIIIASFKEVTSPMTEPE